MADVECSGIWEVNPPEFPDEKHIPLDYEELDIQKALADKFTAWIVLYWDYIDHKKSFNFTTYNQIGKRLAKELKICLGNDYYVGYREEDEITVKETEEIT